MKHYSWLGPLALALPSARQREQTEAHHHFLLHAKTILDAFGQAARLTAACIEGARACPPEDSGGPHGYMEMLQVLNDPDHEEYEHFRNWLPRNFEPEKFDLDRTNHAIKRKHHSKKG